MDLRVRCVTPSATIDIALDVEPGHTIGALRDALVDHVRSLGLEVDDAAQLTVRGSVLDPDASVFASGIATGDELGLGLGLATPSGAQCPFIVRVAVVGGPDAGSIVLLGPGRHTIGRTPDIAVPLTDASLAPAHAHLDIRSDSAVRVVPVAGGTAVEGTPVSAPTRLGCRAAVRVGSTVLEVSVVHRGRPTDALGTVAHNRTPYRRPIVHPRVLAPLDKPPEVATRPRFGLASALLPVASGGMLVVISGRVQFLFLVLLSPLLLGWSFFQDRRSGRRRYELDRTAYLEAVDDRLAAGAQALDDERIERLRAAPDMHGLAPHAQFLQPRLWERDRATSDFGELRVGTAAQPSHVTVDIAPGGDGALVREAQDRLAHLAHVGDAPISVEFDATPVIAVLGDDDSRHAVARSVLAQAAVLHSPEDLVVMAIVSASALAHHEWLKWLPHARSSSSPVGTTGLAMWKDEQARLLVELANLVEQRASDSQTSPGADTAWPRVLVLIDAAASPDRTVLSRVLDGAAAAAIWVLWVDASSDGVPRQAEAMLQCVHGSTRSVLDWREVTRPAVQVTADLLEIDEAVAIARAIAPVRDATSATQIAALPRRVDLYDVLPGGRPDPRSILDQWARSGDGLAAGVGIGSDGVYLLDLVDQGPHALIAGTSGAGKSEFLQSWVVAMAAAHPPDQLNFLFIDYKGGAFSAAFDDLPHTVGSVTNLDEALSLRALTSLRAELDRRMQAIDAKDIAELRAIDPARAPARLVIIVDEFATLVKEIPDFVAGMVDLAQRGRSLGIHLVLATQRPLGSVNDSILANTNLRISLRVLDAADSTSVIGAPDAAQLPVPLRGRAFARTGPGRLHAFQGAYGGAPDVVERGPGRIAVGSFDFGGVLRLGADEPPDAHRSQLAATVSALAAAFDHSGLARPSSPWLDPLPPTVTLDEIERPTEVASAQERDPGRRVTFGIADRPALQRRDAWTVDLEATGGLLVFGAGGAGRTTVLRSIAVELARQGGPEAVTIHAIDAGRSLGSIGPLPNVASVLSIDELEPLARLVQVLERAVRDRRELLSATNADMLSALREERGRPVVPRLVILIDGLGALREALDTPDGYDWFNRLVRLMADGRPVGIHFVAASDRRAGLPASVVGSLTARLVLRMGDIDEAISLGVPRPIASAPDIPPGRGHADRAQVQIGVVGPDPSGPGQAAAIAGLPVVSGRDTADPLPALPTEVTGAMKQVAPLVVDLGVTDLDAGPARLDLAAGHLVVTGPAGSGRSSTLVAIAGALGGASDRPQLVGVGGSASPLVATTDLDEATFARSGHVETLEALASTVDPDGTRIEAVVFVDAAEDLAAVDTDRALERLAALRSVRLVVVVDPATLSRSFSGWMAEVKRHRRMLYFQPEGSAEIDAVLGQRVALRPGQPFPVGRALLAAGRSVSLVQVRHEKT